MVSQFWMKVILLGTHDNYDMAIEFQNRVLDKLRILKDNKAMAFLVPGNKIISDRLKNLSKPR